MKLIKKEINKKKKTATALSKREKSGIRYQNLSLITQNIFENFVPSH